LLPELPADLPDATLCLKLQTGPSSASVDVAENELADLATASESHDDHPRRTGKATTSETQDARMAMRIAKELFLGR